MSLRKSLTLLLFFVPGFLAAEPDASPAKEQPHRPPEALLSADTLFYFRFDGFEPHREAADKTAYAEMMRGDLGRFIDHLCHLVKEQAMPDALEQAEDEEGGTLVAQVPNLLDYLNRHGVVAGLETSAILPLPRAQLTVVFPEAGDGEDCRTLTSILECLAQSADLEVEKVNLDGRMVSLVALPIPVRIAWWSEGAHLVLIAGTEPVSHTLALARTDAKDHLRRMNLTQNPLFQSVANFKKYETVSRGFFDCERALELAADLLPADAKSMLDELGLTGLKSVTWHCGYEGKATRSTLAVHMTRERKGLLNLTSDVSCLYLAKLPPMPPDATDIHVLSVDWAKAYDVLFHAYERLDPEGAAECRLALDEMGELTGVDWRQNLMEALGATVVTYNSPSEGWRLLGLGLAVQVRDAAKMQQLLEALAAAVSRCSDSSLAIRKRSYHNVPLYTLQVVDQPEGLPVVPSYTIHDGWLVAGLFPQRVQGYILRATEDYPAWKPSPQLVAAMEAARSNGTTRILSLAESNPEPTIKFLISFAPLLGGYLNMTAPDVFDPALIPNAHNVAHSLFPNVTLWLDDGNTIRCESYASFALPFDPCSIAEWCGVACAASALNGIDDLAELVNISCDGHCQLAIPGLVQATYADEVLPPNAVPQPGASPVPVQPTQPQAAAPPLTPLPAERVGLDFNSLWRMATNPPAPPPPVAPGQPIPIGPPVPNNQRGMPAPMNVAPLPPGTRVLLTPATPAMPQMPQVPAMPAVPAMTQMLPFRSPPAMVAPPAGPLTLRAYPVADLVGKEEQVPQAVLIRLVKMVEPTSWDDMGGFGGIDYFPLSNSLIVRQTADVHEKIDKFLKDLRESVAKQKK